MYGWHSRAVSNQEGVIVPRTIFKIKKCLIIFGQNLEIPTVVENWPKMYWLHVGQLSGQFVTSQILTKIWQSKKWCNNCNQSLYRKVPRCKIFMEQELRFGLDLGQLAVQKKRSGPIISNFWGCFFHTFMGKKKFNLKNIVASSQ